MRVFKSMSLQNEVLIAIQKLGIKIITFFQVHKRHSRSGSAIFIQIDGIGVENNLKGSSETSRLLFYNVFTCTVKSGFNICCFL